MNVLHRIPGFARDDDDGVPLQGVDDALAVRPGGEGLAHVRNALPILGGRQASVQVATQLRADAVDGDGFAIIIIVSSSMRVGLRGLWMRL